MYSIYLSLSDLLSFIISNTDKHEFSSIWKWIGYSNDVMNHVDFVIKRDVYPYKRYSCSKNIRGISFFVLKLSMVYQEKLYHRCYCMGNQLAESFWVKIQLAKAQIGQPFLLNDSSFIQILKMF